MHDVGTPFESLDNLIMAEMGRVERHDLSYHQRDSAEWLVTYSLQNHMAHVGNTMVKIGRHLGWSEYDVKLSGTSGLLHDVGKLDEFCEAYRLNRPIEPEEKMRVDRHACFSGNRIRALSLRAYPEDRPLLLDAAAVADCHHKGYNLLLPRLRTIAYFLKTVDAWVGVQEDRHRPGMGLAQANKWLESLDFVRQEKDEYHKPHVWIIEDCKQAIFDLFGLNLHKGE